MRTMPSSRPSGRLATLPAPIGGWNARDPLSAMQPTDAVQLDNFIPGTGGVDLRPGFVSHATGLTDAVESLMEHNAPSGTRTLFAAAGTKIYDVTNAGPVGAAAVTGLTHARWQHTMFATAGGNFLVICNGADAVRHYNGATWSTPSITGVSSASLIGVAPHMARLWFIEKNTLRAWYLAVNAIAGAATPFDIGPQCRLGGSLTALASWTRDGGSGPDDTLVFITSAGEALLYSGIDPDSASTWSLVGRFRIPEPVGHRCVVKAGADVGLITSQGVLPLSGILPLATAATGRVAVTDRIRGAFAAAYRAGGGFNGWQVIEYPRGALMIVNVPTQSGSTSDQYVMNANTGAWCRFTGLDALAWSLLGDRIFFGHNTGTVFRFDVDHNDDGQAIRALAFPAFSAFGSQAKKRFTFARPLFSAAEGTEPPVVARVDYDTSAAALASSFVPSFGAAWDVSDWDTSAWGPSTVPLARWQSIQGLGQVGSVILGVTSQTPLTLNQIDILYEPGGVL
jgi:hypothetical protein